MATGIVLINIDGLDKFTINVAKKHARSCPAGKLEVVKQNRFIWDLNQYYHCFFCTKELTFSTKEADGIQQKQSRQMWPINKIMPSSVFKSGCMLSQVHDEMFKKLGKIGPSKKGLGKNMENVNGSLSFY